MQTMKNDNAVERAALLDKIILYTGSGIPVGMVIGNIGFEIMIALTGLAWLLRAFFLKENPFSNIFMKPAVLAWAAWLLCIFLSLAVNGPGNKGLLHDIVYFRFFLYACAMIDLSGRKNITAYLLWGLAAGVLFAAFNTIMAYGVGFDLFGRTWEHYTSKLRIAARISAMGAMAAPIFWGWAMANRSEKLKNWSILFVISSIAVLNTIQARIRTAIIALFAGIFFALIYNRYKKMDWREKVFWPALTVFAIWFIIKQGDGWGLSSVYHRIAIWKISIAMWMDNLLLGVGISSWSDAYFLFASSGKIAPYVAPNGVTYALSDGSHAHNLFLMLMSASGTLGLLSFLYLFGCCIMSVINNNSPWKLGLITWPVVFLVLGLTGWNIYSSSYNALFSFFTVLTLSSNKNNKHILSS